MPAVSVRRTRGPSRTGLQPRSADNRISSSEKPPSGPTAKAIFFMVPSSLAGLSAPGASIRRASASTDLSASSRLLAARTQGTTLRPHCSAAPRAMSRHLSRRFSRRSPERRVTLRAAGVSTTSVTPVSTAFSMIQSSFSGDTKACRSVIRTGDSRRGACALLSFTQAESRSIRISPCHSRPVPAKIVTVSPFLRRKARLA